MNWILFTLQIAWPFAMIMADVPVIKITMKTYQNPGGKNVRGKCCDGTWPFCQKNGCDHYFKICLDTIDSDSRTDLCPYGKADVDRTKNQDSIIFGRTIGRHTANPIVFKLYKGLPDRIALKVKVMDNDKYRFTHDDVDFFRKNLVLSEIRGKQTLELRARTRLVINIEVACETDKGQKGQNTKRGGGRGGCPAGCKVRGNIIRCNPDGTAVCRAGWKGNDCDIPDSNGYDCRTSNPCTRDNINKGHYFHPHRDRSKYIQCNPSGHCFEMNCPPGTEWSQRILTCDHAKSTCSSGQFQCGTGQCIHILKRCNTVNNCRDRSDERNCAGRTCPRSQFTCGDGKCIPRRKVCDKIRNCANGIDERKCRRGCGKDEYKCRQGQCIPKYKVCDGSADCPEAEDEHGCVKTCGVNEFTCRNEKCVSLEERCDTVDDCGDNSDEISCAGHRCPDYLFSCGDGKCIPDSKVCDTITNCANNADEKSCKKSCETDEYRCADEKCIHGSYVCDGSRDCSRGEDERNCGPVTCRPGLFHCASGRRCLSKQFVCDGEDDCGDGSDEHERLCRKAKCQPEEFRCSDGECINNNWKCDQNKDCSDGSDEKGCCEKGEFECGDGQCLPSVAKCNKLEECPDGSDEANCPGSCSDKQFDCRGDGSECIPKTRLCNQDQDCSNGKDESRTQCMRGACERPDRCSQICTTTANRGFKCSCAPGFTINPRNNTSCLPEGNTPRIIYSIREQIIDHSLQLNKSKDLVIDLTNAVSLDLDIAKSQVYFTDVDEEKIFTFSMKDSKHTVSELVSAGIKTPDGIALDWIHDNLYWTDTGNDKIEVMNIATKKRKILVDSDMEEPRAIVVDPRFAYMYWTDWGLKPRIEKAGMDGTQRKAIIEKGIYWPNGLTIDYVNDRMYWVDGKLHLIGVSDLNGARRANIMTGDKTVGHPFAITVFGDYLYVSDWNSHKINRINKINTADAAAITAELQQTPMDLKVLHKNAQPSAINRCGSNNAGCSFLCLPSPRSLRAVVEVCVCPNGENLQSDGKNCK